MPEGATHKQGIYVVLKLLEVGDCADILPLASKLFPGGPKLTTDLHSPEAWRGVKIMTGLVDAMVRCLIRYLCSANRLARAGKLSFHWI